MYSNLILTFSRFEFYIKILLQDTAHNKNGNYDEDKYKKNSVVS